MELPNRKPNRNAHIDYNRAGAYFLTLCVQDRRPILSEIGGDGSIILTEYGAAVEAQIQECNRIYTDIRIEQYCIMPDHIHMIVVNMLSGHADARKNDRIPALISSFKRFINKRIGFSIWQRSYYDTVLHDAKEYNAAVRYIADNPRNRLAEWAAMPFVSE